MKKAKIFNIPYTYNISNLSVRVVLFEKIHPKLEGVNFCCYINDIPIYSDSNAVAYSVTKSSNGFKDSFIIVGLEPEEIKTNSFILQSLANLLKVTK